jgi:uncharacterized protein
VIELSKLPPEGLRLDGSSELLQIDENETLRCLSWQIFAQPSNKDIFLDVRADAIYEGTCSRCLESVDVQAKIQAQFLGSHDPDLVARGTYVLGTQDLDVVYLPEEALDECALVREQFILQRPMQLLCKDDCLGLCPQCGKNWNKGRCHCCPGHNMTEGALAKALSGIQLDLKP